MSLELLFIIICILIAWCILAPTNMEEGFESMMIRNIHARLDPKGGVLYYDFQSPTANGELGCTQVPCPECIEDHITCWCCCSYH